MVKKQGFKEIFSNWEAVTIVISLSLPTTSEITSGFSYSYLLHVVNGISYNVTGNLKVLQATLHQPTRYSANKSLNNKASEALGTSKNDVSHAMPLLQMVTDLSQLVNFQKNECG